MVHFDRGDTSYDKGSAMDIRHKRSAAVAGYHQRRSKPALRSDWTALKPCKWMIHRPIAHHANNNTEIDRGLGLMMHIELAGDPRT